METIKISVSETKKTNALINFLKSLDYIDIQQSQELTAKQEHEEFKQIMLDSSKRFVTNILAKHED